jgi:hypothetical protein
MATFFILLLEHLAWFLTCLAAVAACVYFLLRRHIFSVIDPIFYFLVISETFCITDVAFMFRFGMIDTRIAVNYFLTEAALFIGILQFRTNIRASNPTQLPATELSPLASRVLYRISLALFVALNLLVYAMRGIPVFMASRLEIYRKEGWGVLDRAFDVLLVIIVYYLMDVLRRRRWILAEWASLLILLVIEILSGAKIAVLQLFFIAGLACYFTGTAKAFFTLKSKYFRNCIFIAIAGALVVVTIQRNGMQQRGEEQPNPLTMLVIRMVSNGDAFMYAYPNGYIDQLDSRNPLGALLKDYLATFRIAKPDELPTHIGVQLSEHFTGHGDEFQTNAKHNLFGLVYFGFWGSILYSYLVGSSIGFVRHTLWKKLPRNWIGGTIFILMSLGTIQLVNESDVANRYVIDTLVFFLPMVFLAIALATAIRPSSKASGTLSGEARPKKELHSVGTMQES